MRETVYYYEFFKEHREGFKVYESDRFQYRLWHHADRIWKQGKMGGVKIIQENWMSPAYESKTKKRYGHKYMTKNEDAMREFAWVKLSAQQYTKEK